VPLRALLPKGLDGILVTGLGVSAHRDAMPIIRMQPDVQNQGYACGYAAALVAQAGKTIRQLDVKAMQKHLVEIQCLPETALTDKDSMPLPREQVAEAVASVTQPPDAKVDPPDSVVKNRKALAVIFAQPQDSVPLLKKTISSADGDTKLAYAQILGMMGDATGADTLLAAVRDAKEFDAGWNFKGGGQFGRSLSQLDSYIIALGRTRDPRALDAVLEKVKQLDATKELSHHRACALALETLGDPRGAVPLAELLAKPYMTGHAFPTVEKAKQDTGPGGAETKPRNDSLRELVLARALFRCGDKDGLGERILKQYAQDLRGHYARHAQAVLDEKSGR
ncbi:MAG: FAD-dependent oxidoreductase, partial [Verrucomicrobia bacterium]|nr:FAD-dependent oxidoreductase [Verrucomicrobiota bacterium]